MSSYISNSYTIPSLSTIKTHQLNSFPSKACYNNVIFTKTYSSQIICNCEKKLSSPPMSIDYNASNLLTVLIDLEKTPKHVAIILDGSRRWFKAHGKPLTYGPLFQAKLLFADLCIKFGVATATTFVYSLKNLERGKEANDMLFGELETFLEDNIENFTRKGVKVSIIGERSVIPESLQDTINRVEDSTKECTKLELMLAVCYSRTRDIVEATKSICEKVKIGVIEPNDIDEVLLEQHLWTKGSNAPHVDLFIRTGHRLRVSNYLMWQLAQSEFYFADIYAPEFGEGVFVDALRSYQLRERTFGM